MPPTPFRLRAPALVFLGGLTGLAGCVDAIRVTKGDKDQFGALVDGKRAGADLNDVVYERAAVAPADPAPPAEGRPLWVGNFEAPPAEGNVIVFGRGLAPTAVAAPWTPEVETLVVETPAPVPVKLRFWLFANVAHLTALSGSPGCAEFPEWSLASVEPAQAPQLCGVLGYMVRVFEMALDRESAGLVLAGSELHDIRGHVGQEPLAPFACSESVFKRYEEAIRAAKADWDPCTAGNVLDVLLVDDITAFHDGQHCPAWEGSPGWTRSCGDKPWHIQAIELQDAGLTVLAHELGHAFGLTHPNELPGVSSSVFPSLESNLMNSSLGDIGLTEGQTFRAHHLERSVLRSHGLRTDTAYPTDCPESLTPTPLCPAVQTRVFPDGVTP